LNSAFCPIKQVEGNPVLEYAKYIIFKETDTMMIERPPKFGGNLELHSYEELEKIYRDGKLHPSDLKMAVAVELDKLIKPVREYFEKNKSNLINCYPEQFDITFDFVPRMCAKRLCRVCPFGENGVDSICLPSQDRFCPVALVSCGYLIKCVGRQEDCIVGKGIGKGLCNQR